MESHPLKIYRMPEFKTPSLLVGWSQDIGKLGPGVIDFLNKKLGGQEFCQIELPDFFPLGGVAIENNIVQFPESKFYSCQQNDLIILGSDPPSYEQYKFLNSILDLAQSHCNVKELYTIGGIVSLMAHTSPRRILTVANQPELKEMLAGYDLETDLDYQTHPGERPTLSSFLLWIAKKRNITGASLWVEVPFYLAGEDPKAVKSVIQFLDKRFNLGMDLGELDLEIKNQGEQLELLRRQDSEVDKYIGMLERGVMLSHNESEKLAEEVMEFLERKA